MELGLDSSTAFYALGVIFGVFTVLYFGMEVILEISPYVKSAILLLVSASFFTSTGLASTRWGKLPLYLLASVTYLVFTAYSLVKFDPGSVGTFIFLSLSSGLFFGAGYAASNDLLEVDERKIKALLGVLLALAAGLFVFDASAPDNSVMYETRPSVSLESGEEISVGKVKVSNPFVLPRDYSLPSFGACLEGSERGVSVYAENAVDMIPAGGSVEMDLKARFYPRGNVTGEFEVRKADGCLDEEGVISIYERNYD